MRAEAAAAPGRTAAAPGGAAALAPVGCGFRKPMQSRGRVALYRKAEFWAAVESEMDLSALPRIAAMLARTRAGLADEVQPLSPRRGWKAHDRIFGRVVAPMQGVAPGHIVEVDGWVEGLFAQPRWRFADAADAANATAALLEAPGGANADAAFDAAETVGWVAERLEALVVPALATELGVLLAEVAADPEMDPFHKSSSGFASIRLLESYSRAPTPLSALFPETMAALQRAFAPDQTLLGARHVMLSRQMPGSGIARHSDGSNCVLTAHCGVRLGDPAQCGLVVGGGAEAPEETLRWREGATFVYDTAYEHHTFNGAAEARYILHVDLWHPGLAQAERKALAQLRALRRRFFQPDGDGDAEDASWALVLDELECVKEARGLEAR
mmetsp:Transcript_202/g.688  ORF Transcript_202/g.688 Transcript_202/m.688 type:complete len:385 (-) Transcript_202:96-1250(-)